MKRKIKKVLLGSFFAVVGVGAITGAIVGSELNHSQKSNSIETNNSSSTNKIVNHSSSNNINNSSSQSSWVKRTLDTNNFSQEILANSNNILVSSNSLQAIISGSEEAILSAVANTESNVKVTYQWYTTNSSYAEASQTASTTLVSGTDLYSIQGATSNKLSVTTSNLKSSGSYTFYLVATPSYNGDSIAFSPVISDSFQISTINISNEINSQAVTASQSNISIANSNSAANLQVTLSNEDATNLTYKWYKSSSNTISSSSTSVSSSSSYSVTSAELPSGEVSYYLVEVTGTLNGQSFTLTSSPFLVSNIGINQEINNKEISQINLSQSNNEATLSGTLNNSNATVTSYQWYYSSAETYSNSDEVAPGDSTSSTYSVTTNNTSTYNETTNNWNQNKPVYYLEITYTYDGYSFSVISNSFTVINIGLTSSINSGTTSNSPSKTSSSDSSSKTQSSKSSSQTNPEKTTTNTPQQKTATAPVVNIAQQINNTTTTSPGINIGTVTQILNSKSTNIVQAESAKLGIDATTSQDISAISYQWYSSSSSQYSTTSVSPISNSDSSTYTVSASSLKNQVTYYFCKMTYTYEGSTFETISKAFIVTNIDTTVNVSYKYDWGAMNNKATASVTLPELSNQISDVTYAYTTLGYNDSGHDLTSTSSDNSSYKAWGIAGQTYYVQFTISFKVDNITISFQVNGSNW